MTVFHSVNVDALWTAAEGENQAGNPPISAQQYLRKFHSLNS
jgi:hypothetical protein